MYLSFYIKCLIFFMDVMHDDPRKIEINGTAQGTTYHIAYYSTDNIVSKQQIDSILNKLDSSLSLYKSYSIINQFNFSEGGAEIDSHLRAVYEKSKEVYYATSGLFDITVLPLVNAWGFGIKKVTTIPEDSMIGKLKNCVGANLLEIKENYLCKKKPCVTVDMNGIAQGYSVDIIADFLERHHLVNYVVELGGELRIKGRTQSGEKIKIGIESPAGSEFNNELNKILLIDSGAITTSGNYRQFYETNGKKLTHLINPLTGYPAQNELISVTVYAKNAITADAYDNALMLMGLNEAIHFVERINNVEAYFIYKKPDGVIADTASCGFYKMFSR